MANIILNNGNVIWKCSNTLLAAIYKTIKDIIKTKKISNKNLQSFIEKLDQDFYGSGCICVDIKDDLKDPQERIEFASIFKQAIDLTNEKNQWTEEIYRHTLKFYQYLESVEYLKK